MIKSMSRGVGGRVRGKPSSTGRKNVGGGSSGNQYHESNGPGSVKIKGSISQIFERYTSLAKDAQQSGADRVQVENLMQHADHYARILKKRREKSNGVAAKQQMAQEPAVRRRNRFDADTSPRTRDGQARAKSQDGTINDTSEDEDKQGLLDVLGIDRDV